MHRSQIEALRRNLDQVSAEVDSRCKVPPIGICLLVAYYFLPLLNVSCYFIDHYEIQGLKDSLLVEQEEKNELNKRLRDMEKECEYCNF